MARAKKINPVTIGAIGAVAGTAIGAATGVLLSNKKARDRVKAGLKDLKGYTDEVMDSALLQKRKFRLAGVKGGASRRITKAKRKVAGKSKVK